MTLLINITNDIERLVEYRKYFLSLKYSKNFISWISSQKIKNKLKKHPKNKTF